MKKILLTLVGLLIIVLVGAYVLLFTPVGNGMVASIIENKANETKKANFKVETFMLNTSDIHFKAVMDSNSSIEVKGKFALLDQSFDFNYDANVKDLSQLKTLINADLQGSFNTVGTVKGTKELMRVQGKSNMFDSNTTYDMNVVDFKPQDILFNVNNAKIQKILHLVKQPLYTKGKISINGNLKNLEGNITTKISEGLLNNKVVNEAFNQKLVQPLMFKADVLTQLTSQQAISKVDFLSSMANVFAKKMVVNLKDASLLSDYQVQVSDLAKLYDVSQTKMRGKVLLNGSVKKDKDLLVRGTSKLLGGMLGFKLLNDDLSSTIKNIDVRKALHMMYYPEVFTSKGNVDVTYNLKEKKGQISGALLEGKFLPNQYSSLLKNLAKFDITKEVYKDTTFKSNINKEIIKSTLNMRSKYTTIDVKKSTIDTKKRTVDANIDTVIKKVTLKTEVTGSLDKPKIKIDTTQLIKDKVKSKLQKKIDEKIGGEAGNLLKKLFQ
jgi:hypothetical protein